MDDVYKSITKINYIIQKLPEDSFQKVPPKVVNFFETYSDFELLKNEEFSAENIMSNLNENDLNFLKIIDYYINK